MSDEAKPFSAEEALEWARDDERVALKCDRDCPSDAIMNRHADNLRRRATTLRGHATLLAEVKRLQEDSDDMRRARDILDVATNNDVLTFLRSHLALEDANAS